MALLGLSSEEERGGVRSDWSIALWTSGQERLPIVCGNVRNKGLGGGLPTFVMFSRSLHLVILYY